MVPGPSPSLQWKRRQPLRIRLRKAGPSAAPPSSPGAAMLLEKRLALPVREVAAFLGIFGAAVRLMIARGGLPGRKSGRGGPSVAAIVHPGALLSWVRGAG